MKKIFVTADSGADLADDVAAKLGIRTVPFHVSVGDVHFDDGDI